MNAIVPHPESHQQFRRPVQLAALKELLCDSEIEIICGQLGHTWRHRELPPGTTVRSLVYRSLHPDKSIQALLADLAAAKEQTGSGVSDSAWCQARSRLPHELWPILIRRSSDRVVDLVGNQYLYRGRPVFIADGSTLSMPDTTELVEAFGYANTKHGLSRFPVARVTFIVRSGVEAILDYRLGAYRTSEDAQLRQMWDRIPKDAILILDKRFGSFYNLAKLSQGRVDVIVPLHQRRDAARLIAKGKSLGSNEWIVKFDLSPQSRKMYDDPSLPRYLAVRLIRVGFLKNGKRRQMWLVTTLLDSQEHPRARIIALYRSRWGIETRIGSVKTTLEMSVLRSKGPKAVRYEVAATVLAYNLAWTVIHQAARRTRTPADRISFAHSIKAILAFSTVLRNASGSERTALYHQMLDNIAGHTNLHRPGRVEPRLIKREVRRYGLLRMRRDKARELCLS